jgi:hypothetical protein
VFSSQIFLISGTPTPKENINFAAALFQVADNGEVGLVSNLVPQSAGIEWVAISYDLKKALLLPRGDEPVVVVDLEKAAITKRCKRPMAPNTSLIEQWLADLPSRGATFEWWDAGDVNGPILKGMVMDESVPCEDSFVTAAPTDLGYFVDQGQAGVGGLSFGGGTDISMGPDGALAKRVGSLSAELGYRVPIELRVALDKPLITTMDVNTSDVLVITALQDVQAGPRSLAFRKRDRTWHVMPREMYPAGFRGFGRFVAATEARTKQAVTSQLQRTGILDINKEVRQNEQSTGRSEWRKEDGTMGPNMERTFDEAASVYPGRLHVYNIYTEKLFTITTNQGDSEILLIEDNTVYYRVSNRLYTAPITDSGIGAATLIATDEAIRDAHWAFTKR